MYLLATVGKIHQNPNQTEGLWDWQVCKPNSRSLLSDPILTVHLWHLCLCCHACTSHCPAGTPWFHMLPMQLRQADRNMQFSFEQAVKDINHDETEQHLTCVNKTADETQPAKLRRSHAFQVEHWESERGPLSDTAPLWSPCFCWQTWGGTLYCLTTHIRAISM